MYERVEILLRRFTIMLVSYCTGDTLMFTGHKKTRNNIQSSTLDVGELQFAHVRPGRNSTLQELFDVLPKSG